MSMKILPFLLVLAACTSFKKQQASQLSLFNQGAIQLQNKKCQEAVKTYKTLLKSPIERDLKTSSLMKLSEAYECLANYKKSLEVLEKIKLPHASAELEYILYPARLSLAYMKLGKTRLGKIYQDRALNGLLSLKNIISTQKDMQSLSRLFYIIGRVHTKTELIDASFLRTFYQHQVYLLESVFFNHTYWAAISKKHLNDLVSALAKKTFTKTEKKILHKIYKKTLPQLKKHKPSSFTKAYKNKLKALSRK